MIDHPYCFFFQRHKWISLDKALKLMACMRCGKVKRKDG